MPAHLGVDVLGQTGKFHTSWGDFHSFKSLAALQFEVFRMLAMNAKCMIGDQLPPRGRIEPHVYELIGKVYAEVEQRAVVSWAQSRSARSPSSRRRSLPAASAGACPMPSRAQRACWKKAAHQFDIVDSPLTLTPYRVVILPDAIPVARRLPPNSTPTWRRAAN
jgi:hypothetical protein